MFNITKDLIDKEEEQIRRTAPHIRAVHVHRTPTGHLHSVLASLLSSYFFVVILLYTALSVNARAYHIMKDIHMKE